MRKHISGIMLTLLLISVLIPTFSIQPAKAEPTTWIVDDDGPADFGTIQEAVNAASPGDTIIVKAGTYTENVKVNKDHLIIKSENGAEVTIVKAANPNDHVFMINMNYVNISGFKVEGATGTGKVGIYFTNVGNSFLTDNNLNMNYVGIRLDMSSNNTLANNIISNNYFLGIIFDSSSNNTLVSNTVSSNNYGIYLWNSNYNVLKNNTASNSYGYYGTPYGISLKSSSYNILTNNTASNNSDGINLIISSKNTLIGNILSNNYQYGICFIDGSNNNTLNDNNVSTNRIGIALTTDSSYNSLTGNNALDNTVGISLDSSSNNKLTNNVMSANDYNFVVEGSNLSHFIQSIDTSNKVNGKPIQYLINKKDLIIDSNWGLGYLGIVNSTNITVKDLTLTHSGILLAYSNDSRIENMQISNNLVGIYLLYSSNTLLFDNVNLNNNWNGIRLKNSNNNRICLNNLMQNQYNVYSESSTNIWNSLEPINYIYNGKTFTNYLGNYWSDYTGTDADGDGIGDTPYSIDGDKDNYPLMQPYENYLMAPPENQPPSPAIDLGQFKIDGTAIGVGATTYETTVMFKGRVSDPDGDRVKLQVELRRLSEFSGQFDESASGFKESEFVESGSEASAYGYGLIVEDYHWRTRTVDEHGLASDWVDFGNNIIPEADFTVSTVSKLRDTINRRLQQWVTYPSYLINLVPWINHEKYDEFYWAGIDYDCLKLNALIKARDSLESGNIGSAEKYLQMSETYGKISDLCFQAALAVYDQNLAEAEVLAQEIETLCQKAVVIGLYGVNPTLAETVDYIYLALDWAIDRTLVGTEQATKDLIVKLMVKKFFELRFEGFDDRTISDWAKNRVGKYLFPILANWIKSEESQWAFSKIIKEVVIEIGSEIIDIPAERLIQYITEEVKDTVNFVQPKIESPGELRIYDSQGRVTGLLNGEVRQEIQRSVYYEGTVIIFYPSESYWHKVAGTDDGTYGLTVTFVKGGDVTTFTAIDIPTWANAIHQYTIDWDALSKGEEGVTVQIDSDGDGVFEQTITTGNTFYVPTIETTDISGNQKDIFLPFETVYINGSSLHPSTTYPLYVVSDTDWFDGKLIPQRVSGTETTVTTDVNGRIPVGTEAWKALLKPGKYDIIIDVNGNGKYDEYVDVLDDGDIEVTAGFNVIPELPIGTITALVTMFASLVFFKKKKITRRKPKPATTCTPPQPTAP